ncbi:MAG: N-acetylmuramoyl-L-alanine amidase [Paenibacillus sp.]|nr:N-acetylmuramoyl-L-alanine amidase [Paenibacillus sp.]
MISAVAAPPMQAKDYVVVIDPGHGGKDAGALGARTNEKTVNLKVARKLQKMLQDGMDDVKVVMTRDDDRFIPLQRRADIANGKHADIFISIHANSISKKSPMHKRINGAAVYTLGLDKSDTNLSVAMRENEVMKMEDDYTSTYQGFDPSSTESYIAFEMMQHKNMDQSIALAEAVQNQLVRHAGRKNNGVRQAPFWVLVRTSMPAILVELDFICNPAMETFMSSDAGSTKLARAIYNGVERYRTTSSSRATTKSNPRPHPASKARPEPEETVPDGTPVTKAETNGEKDRDIVYKIQFLTAPKAIRKGDARFKKLSPVDSYKDGGMIKYTYGAYYSMAEANRELKKVKKKFPDAFVIKTRNGKRVK